MVPHDWNHLGFGVSGASQAGRRPPAEWGTWCRWFRMTGTISDSMSRVRAKPGERGLARGEAAPGESAGAGRALAETRRGSLEGSTGHHDRHRGAVIAVGVDVGRHALARGDRLDRVGG